MPVKILEIFFFFLWKLIGWFCSKFLEYRTHLKMNKLGEHTLTLPDCKVYYKASGVKTWEPWCKDGQVDQ